VLVDIIEIAHVRARETDELPADQVSIAAVHGVAKYAFDGVGAEEREKRRVLDLVQFCILFGRCQKVKTAQSFQSCPVELARGFLSLPTLLGDALLKRRLRVAVLVAAISGGELAINIDNDAGFVRAWAGCIAGKDARGCGGYSESFLFGEEAEREFERAGLRVNAKRSAIEGVDEQAAEGGSREI